MIRVFPQANRTSAFIGTSYSQTIHKSPVKKETAHEAHVYGRIQVLMVWRKEMYGIDIVLTYGV
jgi:hypothetical protein